MVTRHLWTSVQSDHAICLEIHGVLGFRQIADKLNAAFGSSKDYYTVKYHLDCLAGRLKPSEAARRAGGNFVHDEWRYWLSRRMHHQDVQDILRVHGLFEEEVPEEGDEDEEMTEAEDEGEGEEGEDEEEEEEEEGGEEGEEEESSSVDSELDSAVTA
ncbi:retrotransposon-like protein 1 [Xylographa opegraphella]|nr:retrotransposon-like protein 1 [Xylographa opegraphella]